MSSFGCGRAYPALRSAACAGAALAFSLIASVTFSSAQAQQLFIGGCVGGGHAVNCTALWAPAGDPYFRHVPRSSDPADQARARERGRRWADRCRPSIRQDRYGVPRYSYAMPGCEFGVGEY